MPGKKIRRTIEPSCAWGRSASERDKNQRGFFYAARLITADVFQCGGPDDSGHGMFFPGKAGSCVCGFPEKKVKRRVLTFKQSFFRRLGKRCRRIVQDGRNVSGKRESQPPQTSHPEKDDQT